MSATTFKRDTVHRFGADRPALLVKRGTADLGFVFKVCNGEHPDAPCWMLEYASGRRETYEYQDEAKSAALKI